jgi:hypothetical protein
VDEEVEEMHKDEVMVGAEHTVLMVLDAPTAHLQVRSPSLHHNSCCFQGCSLMQQLLLLPLLLS